MADVTYGNVSVQGNSSRRGLSLKLAFGEGAYVTLEDVAEYFYGDARFARYIKEANEVKYLVSENLSTMGSMRLYLDQYLYCPLVYLQDSETIDELSVAVYDEVSVKERASTPSEGEVLSQNSDGIAVLIFKTTPNGTEPPRWWRVKSLIELEIRSSMFEGSRAVQMSWPKELNDDPHMNLYGNRVVIGIDGKLIFAGLLINPSVSVRKSVVMSWVAQSHSYLAIKTHVNPSLFATQWDDMSPLQIINTLAIGMGIPIYISTRAKEFLKDPYLDEDGLATMGNDIRGTTPFKFISKLVSAAGMYTYASKAGGLVISDVDVYDADPEPRVILRSGENNIEFKVKYNYTELARTYSTMTQKRDNEGYEGVQWPEFPLPIFKNSVRTTGAGVARNLADAVYSPTAAFEMFSSLALAVNIKVVVVGWTDDLGVPWEINTPALIYSPDHGLNDGKKEIEAIISGVQMTYNKSKKVTTLSVSLPGAFDVYVGSIIPFLTSPGQHVGFEAINATELGLDNTNESQG